MSIGKFRRKLLRVKYEMERNGINAGPAHDCLDRNWQMFLAESPAKKIRHYLSTGNHVRSLQH